MIPKNTTDSGKNIALTISALAKKFGLSRSTLLYYDSKGLLSPSAREKGDYRIYGHEEVKRLEKICMYRSAGLSLKSIKKILDTSSTDFTAILHSRFEELNREMKMLQDQQSIIVRLLYNTSLVEHKKMSKELWTSILQQTGLSENDMRNWHIIFEKEAPAQHTAFLQYLKIPEREIKEIKSWKEVSKPRK